MCWANEHLGTQLLVMKKSHTFLSFFGWIKREGGDDDF